MQQRLVVAAWLAMALAGCGGSDTVGPEPVPTPTPTPTPSGPDSMTDPNSPIYCTPPPPPLYTFRLKVLSDQGWKKVLDSRPMVGRDAAFCASQNQPGDICIVRTEDSPQAVTCNNAVTGKASDTGRYGPTWYWNDLPCRGIFTGGEEAGCKNHQENQHLAFAFGPGVYKACGANGRCHSFEVK